MTTHGITTVTTRQSVQEYFSSKLKSTAGQNQSDSVAEEDIDLQPRKRSKTGIANYSNSSEGIDIEEGDRPVEAEKSQLKPKKTKRHVSSDHGHRSMSTATSHERKSRKRKSGRKE